MTEDGHRAWTLEMKSPFVVSAGQVIALSPGTLPALGPLQGPSQPAGCIVRGSVSGPLGEMGCYCYSVVLRKLGRMVTLLVVVDRQVRVSPLARPHG